MAVSSVHRVVIQRTSSFPGKTSFTTPVVHLSTGYGKLVSKPEMKALNTFKLMKSLA